MRPGKTAVSIEDSVMAVTKRMKKRTQTNQRGVVCLREKIPFDPERFTCRVPEITKNSPLGFPSDELVQTGFILADKVSAVLSKTKCHVS